MLDEKELIKVLKKEINYVTEVDIFLKDLITPKYIEPKYNLEFPFKFVGSLFILRKWNSYYPSFYDVIGGCYVIDFGSRYTLIDPSYKSIQALYENRIDTRLIQNIIVTHDHLDHIGGLNELLNLLFEETPKNSLRKYTLYVNPGCKSKYKHMKNENFYVKRIRIGKKYVLKTIKRYPNLKYELSFTAYKVHHTGIKKRQKTIGLIFEIRKTKEKGNEENLEDILKFGITSDLDGRKKYIEKYKAIFENLYFLILHLGSLKHEEKEDKKKKHLYIEGLIRLINMLENTKAFVIQEFGLEMISSNKLAKLLTKVIFKNGYYFPYIIFNFISSKNTKEIQNYLFPSLLSMFLTNFKEQRIGMFGTDISMDYNYEKLFEFCQTLVLDLDSARIDKVNNQIEHILLYNIWEKEDLPSEQVNTIMEVFSETWIHLRKYLYLGVNPLNYSKIEELAYKIDEFFPEDRFYKSIKTCSRILIDLCSTEAKKKILLYFEDLFQSNDFHYPSELENKTIIIFCRLIAIEPEYTSVSHVTSLSKLQIFPILIFLSLLTKTPSKRDSIRGIDVKQALIKQLKMKIPKKHIYIGEYGRKIDFDTFFRESLDCIKCPDIEWCKGVRNGEYLFTKSYECIREIVESEFDAEMEKEARMDDQLELQEDYYETREFERLQRKKEEAKNNQLSIKVKEYLTNYEFSEALELVKREKIPFQSQYTEILMNNLINTVVQEILTYFFYTPLYLIKYLKDYSELNRIYLKVIQSKIIEADHFFLTDTINKFANFLKYHYIRRIFHDKHPKTNEIRSIFLKIIMKLCVYICYNHKNFNGTQFTSSFRRIKKILTLSGEKFKIPIRNIFYYNFKYDNEFKENQLRFFVGLFGNKDKKILRVFKEIYRNMSER